MVQREDLSKELSFCSQILAKTIWNYVSFQTAKKSEEKWWLECSKVPAETKYFSEILGTSSLTDPKTGISEPSSKTVARVEIFPCKIKTFTHWMPKFRVFKFLWHLTPFMRCFRYLYIPHTNKWRCCDQKAFEKHRVTAWKQQRPPWI